MNYRLRFTVHSSRFGPRIHSAGRLVFISSMIGQVTSEKSPRISVLGIPIDVLTMDQTIERIEEFIKTREPHTVITADSSGIVEANKDADFFAIFQAADLITADSVGVLWAARRKGTPLPERVSGVD